jgi:DNA primase
MNNSVVEEIKEKLSIEEVVSSYIKLEKTGVNLRACCPFHNEKTPSFFVSPDRGSFYCFGCSKGGDIFTFVEEIEGVDFKEALKILAEKAGVELKFDAVNSQKSTVNSERNILYEILEKATIFFEKELKNSFEAHKYLKDRGVNDKSIKKFRIGYVKDEWQLLFDYLKRENYTDEQILKTGLVIKNEKGRIYDRFRGRIVFPIFDDKGRVIAYSARILHDNKNQPKYINSPETVLFNKSKTLYGFNFAKQTIRKHDFVILVEGQMDVIMTHQIGYTNTVASSGTSFTEEQLKIIKRHTDNLLIAFDGDVAGLKSSSKVWEMALGQDMDLKILPLKQGTDPAYIILKNQNEWKDLVKKSRHIIEQYAEVIKNQNTDLRKQQKEVQKLIYPYIRSIKSYTDKSYFVNKISEIFSIDRDAIWADCNVEQEIEKKEISNTGKINLVNPKEVLYGIYISQPIADKEGLYNFLKTYISDDLFYEMDKRKEKIIFSLEIMLNNYENLKSLAYDTCVNLKISYLENEKLKLNQELSNLPENDPRESKIMKNLLNISRELETVKKKGCQEIRNMI